MQTAQQLTDIKTAAERHESCVCGVLTMMQAAQSQEIEVSLQPKTHQLLIAESSQRVLHEQPRGVRPKHASTPEKCAHTATADSKTYQQLKHCRDEPVQSPDYKYSRFGFQLTPPVMQPASQARHALHASLPAPSKKRKRVQQEAPALQPGLAQAHQGQAQHEQQQPQTLNHQQQDQQHEHQQLADKACDNHQNITASLLQGISSLGLLPGNQGAFDTLTSCQNFDGFQKLSFLTKLLFNTIFAISYKAEHSLTHDTIVQHLSDTADSVKARVCDTSWLTARLGPEPSPTLCHDAEKLVRQWKPQTATHYQLNAEMVARVLPTDLQPAFILCLVGHTGPKTLPDVAADIMGCILTEIDAAIAETAPKRWHRLSQATTKYAASVPCLDPASPEAAVGGALAQLDLQQPQTSPMLNTSQELDTSRVWVSVEGALIRCRLMFDCLPQQAIKSLRKQLPLTQLVALSHLCAKVKFGKNLSQYVQNLCQPDDLADLFKKCIQNADSYATDRAANTFTSVARKLEVLASSSLQEKVDRAVSCLPQRLQCVAACYAVGMFNSSVNRPWNNTVNNSPDDKQTLAIVLADIHRMEELFKTFRAMMLGIRSAGLCVLTVASSS